MEKTGVVRFEVSEALRPEGSVEFSMLGLTSLSILFASLSKYVSGDATPKNKMKKRELQ